ncbi:HAD family hydrolase [Shewanella waksmanii]|uniref:HAD family hydrolase n=1 Tax=Shewanella waksmanii TaxID=213783 RepID=UPI00048FF8BE|nr:HAD family hydrolase [Shewanella waksmanii]
MKPVILFDWGDTLMIDNPNMSGKMCDWPRVEAVNCALQTLQTLSRTHRIFVATNAQDSAVDEIAAAFKRVNLDSYIEGYFCYQNLGIGKGSRVFFDRILAQLNMAANQVSMVGDNLDNDILPAVEAGLNTYWLNADDHRVCPVSTVRVHCLSSLTKTIKSNKL